MPHNEPNAPPIQNWTAEIPTAELIVQEPRRLVKTTSRAVWIFGGLGLTAVAFGAIVIAPGVMGPPVPAALKRCEEWFLPTRPNERAYLGKAKVRNARWKYLRDMKSRSGVWQVWEVTADFHFQNGDTKRQWYEVAVNGDDVGDPGSIAIFDGMKEHSDKYKPKYSSDGIEY